MSTYFWAKSFDPSGTAPSNLIRAETVTVSIGSQIIHPSQGPFYQDSFTVTANGQVLTGGVDYQCLVLHSEATQATGKTVMVFVKILNTKVTQVTLSYQSVGGKYSNLYPVFKSFVEGLGSKLVSPIRWVDIMNKPTTFHPAPHYHPYWEISDWQDLTVALGHLLQAVYYQDIDGYGNAYTYLDAQMEALRSSVEGQLTTLGSQVNTFINQTNRPVGTIKLSVLDNDPSKYSDGVWSGLNTGILGSSNSSVMNGQSITLSQDITYPQPDNILLDESQAPILTDDGDFIYLDNPYPATIADPTFDYSTLDETFNVLGVSGYQKMASSANVNATISVDKTTISEGDSFTFTIQTYHYDAPLQIPYSITGIGAVNIGYPISGMITTDASGKATITLTLKENSPATDSQTMTFSIALANEVSQSVNYDLVNNHVKSMTLGLTRYIGVDQSVDTVVVGDLYYLKISSHQFKGQTVRFSAQLDGGGTHEIYINNQQCVGSNGGVVDVTLPNNTGDFYLPLRCIQKDTTAVTNLSISVIFGGVVYASISIPATLFAMSATWVDAVTGLPVTEVQDAQKYCLNITHNSSMVLSFQVAYQTNTLGDVISPSTIGPVIYGNVVGKVRSPEYVFKRTLTSAQDTLSVIVTSPMYSGASTVASFTVPPTASVLKAVNIATGVVVDNTVSVQSATITSAVVDQTSTATIVNAPFVTDVSVNEQTDTTRISIPSNITTTVSDS